MTNRTIKRTIGHTLIALLIIGFTWLNLEMYALKTVAIAYGCTIAVILLCHLIAWLIDSE